jgi:phosphatidylglycerophosphate synthase
VTNIAVPMPAEGPHSGSYRENLRRLSGFQKTSKGAPAYSRFINRRIGRHFAAVAHSWHRTPNQVTTVSALFTFLAIGLIALAKPSAVVGVLISAGLVIGYGLDSADGQLARLRGGGSIKGEWLDHTIDSAKISTLHIAVLVCFYRHFDFSTVTPLLSPLAFGAIANVWFFVIILTDQLRRAHATATGSQMPTSSTPAPLIRSLLVLPTDYGILCLLFLVITAPTIFLTLYTLLMFSSATFLILALPTWYREMSAFALPTKDSAT